MSLPESGEQSYIKAIIIINIINYPNWHDGCGCLIVCLIFSLCQFFSDCDDLHSVTTSVLATQDSLAATKDRPADVQVQQEARYCFMSVSVVHWRDIQREKQREIWDREREREGWQVVCAWGGCVCVGGVWTWKGERWPGDGGGGGWEGRERLKWEWEEEGEGGGEEEEEEDDDDDEETDRETERDWRERYRRTDGQERDWDRQTF